MAQMEWERLLSKNRLGKPVQTHELSNGRSKFESDIDRITFCSAFRRLSRKTQVHPLAPNDHVHNRLSHSLEVARVGAALGQSLGRKIKKELPNDFSHSDIGNVLYAACLAHDIGNPAFGHAGESAIMDWFQNSRSLKWDGNIVDKFIKEDIFQFEGNAQGFRIISQTENHLFSGGLRLTYATLATYLKYPWDIRTKKNKFSVYLSESGILERVAFEVGLVQKSKYSWCRHPLAFLVEAADDICYAIIDLEDAVELQILSFDEVFDLLTSHLELKEIRKIKENMAPPEMYRVNLSRLRGAIFDKLVASAIEAFMIGYDNIMRGIFQDELFSLLEANNSSRLIVASAKRLALDKVYCDTKKVELELGSGATFACLLEAFCNAALKCARHLLDKGRTQLDWKSNLVLKLMKDHSPLVARRPDKIPWDEYQCLRRALDYVSGMTDNYAIYIAQQLQGVGFSGGQRP
jgi:dGTPase